MKLAVIVLVSLIVSFLTWVFNLESAHFVVTIVFGAIGLVVWIKHTISELFKKENNLED